MKILGKGPLALRQTDFSKALLAPIVTLLSFTFFMVVGLRDFDTLHDGYMLAQAIGIRDGRLMHAEVYGHYGPVSPWTQALFLSLPFSEGIALKLWAATQLSLAAGLIADFWRVVPRGLVLRPWVSVLGALAWVGMSDLFIIGTLLPWSSIQALFLVVLATYTFLLGLRARNRSKAVSFFLLSVAGFAIGVLPYARINVGLLFLFFALLIAFIVLKFGSRADGESSMILLAAIGVGASLPALALALTGSFSAYVDQSVRGPSSWAGGFFSQGFISFMVSWFEPFLRFGLLPALFILLIAVIPRIFRRSGLKRSSAGVFLRYATPLILVGLAYVVTVLPLSLEYVGDVFSGKTAWRVGPGQSDIRHDLFRGRANLPYLFAVMSLMVGAIFALRGLRASFQGRLPTHVIGILFVAAGSIAMFSQTFPLNDISHMWWGSAFSPLITIWGIERIWAHHKEIVASAVVLVAVVIGGGVLSAWVMFSQDKVDAPAGSVAEGLSVRAETRDYLNDLLEIVPESRDGKIVFVVTDGVASVIRGEYLAPDENFVWWSYLGPRALSELSDATKVVAQHHTVVTYLGYPNSSEFARDLGFDISNCAGEFCLLERRK